MHLAWLTTFTASRKEPPVEVLERVHAAIIAADFGEPHVQFVLSDAPVAGSVSSVGRVLKRFPEFKRFVQNLPPYPGASETRVISNRTSSGCRVKPSVSRLSLKSPVACREAFHAVGLHFSVPAFSAGNGDSFDSG
jgi:hypothetical protein